MSKFFSGFQNIFGGSSKNSQNSKESKEQPVIRQSTEQVSEPILPRNKKVFSFFAKKNSESQEEKKPVVKGKLFMHLSLRHRLMFIKQLSILIRSGVPILASLRLLKQQSKSRTMNKIMVQVIRDVENGQYLATALSKFRRIFGELTINIIAIGEVSGSLSDNLDHLAVTLKKQQALRRKVVNALVYPVFIIVATFFITIMLTVFFFPKIIPVLKSVSYDLPWTTKSLIFLSTLLKNHGAVILLSVVALVIVIIFLLRIKKVHFWYDKMLMSIPLVRTMIQFYNTANICRTLGLLLNSGVGVVNAFHINSNTTHNLVYKKELNNIAEQLVKGEKISTQTYKNKKLFPLIVSQMVEVGESTGKLSETFLYLANIYEEEMDDITKNLSTSLEPLLLVFMGVLVGFIAISIITPIYGITQHLKPR